MNYELDDSGKFIIIINRNNGHYESVQFINQKTNVLTVSEYKEYILKYRSKKK